MTKVRRRRQQFLRRPTGERNVREGAGRGEVRGDLQGRRSGDRRSAAALAAAASGTTGTRVAAARFWIGCDLLICNATVRCTNARSNFDRTWGGRGGGGGNPSR
uniref:Uncharacterized protein n=1 Tax=Oryza officinalis TaxID=4535 RepID=A0A1V1H758_9ORYZ|nr:hypothetical protein [Oryza officinalis]